MQRSNFLSKRAGRGKWEFAERRGLSFFVKEKVVLPAIVCYNLYSHMRKQVQFLREPVAVRRMMIGRSCPKPQFGDKPLAQAEKAGRLRAEPEYLYGRPPA